MGLRDSVAFLGNRTDTENIYAGLDAVALTSLNEGTPVAIIEAMAAGLAAIATEVGGVPDVVEHGVNGVLIPSGSAAALAGAMLALARDPLERRRLGLAGREMVRARFGAERLVADVAWLYDTELRAKRAAG
jgi:glycosyltransferase involved in cell wall biosynthesis